MTTFFYKLGLDAVNRAINRKALSWLGDAVPPHAARDRYFVRSMKHKAIDPENANVVDDALMKGWQRRRNRQLDNIAARDEIGNLPYITTRAERLERVQKSRAARGAPPLPGTVASKIPAAAPAAPIAAAQEVPSAAVSLAPSKALVTPPPMPAAPPPSIAAGIPAAAPMAPSTPAPTAAAAGIPAAAPRATAGPAAPAAPAAPMPPPTSPEAPPLPMEGGTSSEASLRRYAPWLIGGTALAGGGAALHAATAKPEPQR